MLLLLRGFELFFERLGLRHVAKRLGDGGIVVGADTHAFLLAELRGEDLGLDVGADPVLVFVEVSIGVGDVVLLQKGLEVLHNGVVNCEVLVDGAVGEEVRSEFEERLILQNRGLEGRVFWEVDVLVGRDAAAAVDGASGVGEFDLGVALVCLLGGVAHVVVIVERDVVVGALDEASAGRVVVKGREREAGVVGDLVDRLDEALAKGGFAYDEGAVVILQRTGDDLCGGCGVAVYQDDDGIFIAAALSVIGAIDLVLEGAAFLGDDDLSALKELVAHGDGFVDETARV